MALVTLFLSFLKVGLFAFGGGYAALPLIRNEAVIVHHWLDAQSFANLVTISQMTPGPIAINAATFVGMQTCGIAGAIAATIGCVLPSIAISSILAWTYAKFKNMTWLKQVMDVLRPVVTGLIAAAALSLILDAMAPAGIDWVSIVLFGTAMGALYCKVNVFYILIMCGLARTFLFFLGM